MKSCHRFAILSQAQITNMGSKSGNSAIATTCPLGIDRVENAVEHKSGHGGSPSTAEIPAVCRSQPPTRRRFKSILV